MDCFSTSFFKARRKVIEGSGGVEGIRGGGLLSGEIELDSQR